MARMFRSALLLCAVTLVITANDGQAQILSDGTFDTADYSKVSVPLNGAPAATMTVSQETNGGDPGDYLSVFFYAGRESGPPYSFTLEAAVINNTVSYDPSTEGAISSITFTGDFRVDGGLQSGSPVVYFAEQNGILYYDTTKGHTDPNWTTFANTAPANKFTPTTSAAPLDFSSIGSAIFFGVGSVISGGPTQETGLELDNFRVDVTEAPEPSESLLVGLGLVAILIARLSPGRVRT